jgi:hypothetical protein
MKRKMTSGQYVDYLCDSYGSGRSGGDLEHIDEFHEREQKRRKKERRHGKAQVRLRGNP